jgi:hypothetical protein
VKIGVEVRPAELDGNAVHDAKVEVNAKCKM